MRTRQQSGFMEVLFRQHISDKTNWRTMLKGETEELDLAADRDRLLDECRKDIQELQERFGVHALSTLNGMKTVHIDYPVREFPQSIKSIGFDKEPRINGKLLGIKGQYLILDKGVINIRKFGGYELTLNY